MIPIDKIRNLKTLITHGYPDGYCPDGLSSALILRDALPEPAAQRVAGQILSVIEAQARKEGGV